MDKTRLASILSGHSYSAPADQSMVGTPEPKNATTSPVPASTAAVGEEISDAPKTDDDTAAVEAAPLDADDEMQVNIGKKPRPSIEISTSADNYPVDDTTAASPALVPRRNLRSRTRRQTEQVIAPAVPATQRQARRPATGTFVTHVPIPRSAPKGRHPGQVLNEIEGPNPRSRRRAAAVEQLRTEDAESESLDGANEQTTSACLLGMPLAVLKLVTEYLVTYQQPEKLIQKPSHRRMVEYTKAHVLTVSSEKIVRKRTDKHLVARNLNTASMTNLFLVCRRFRNLGIKLYYGKNTFRFSTDQDLRDWAKAIGSRVKHVRSIQLDSHWEVRFTENRIDQLEFVCDQGIISSPALLLFSTNLKRVHLSVGCAMQWQHDVFRNHKDLDEEIEAMCWTFAIDRANNMVGFLRSTDLQSSAVDVSHTLIFDGAFVASQSNKTDYRERMQAFAWKIASLDAVLPKRPKRQLALEGLLPLVPGPPLPRSSGRVPGVLAGPWSRKPTIDENFVTGNALVGSVHQYDICTKRAEWAGVMSELVLYDFPARRRA